MTLSVATVFHEEIEKAFRNHLPKECIAIIHAMAGQAMQLEEIMNEQQKLIKKLMKFSVLSDEQRKQMQATIDKIEKQGSLDGVMSERVKGEPN